MADAAKRSRTWSAMHWDGPLIALELMTLLRLRAVPVVSPERLGRSQAWFPAVGLALGLALAGIAEGVDGTFSPALTGWLLVGALFLLTGGLHVDGLGDTADGLFGGHTAEERLRIMRDSAVGVLGAATILIVLAIKAAAIAELASFRFEALLLAPALARWSSVVVIAVAPYPRESGLGSAFHETAWPWPLPVATLIVIVPAVLLLGDAAIVMVLVALGVGLLAAAAAKALLGGATGDVYGATIEIAEVAVLISVVAMASEGFLL